MRSSLLTNFKLSKIHQTQRHKCYLYGMSTTIKLSQTWQFMPVIPVLGGVKQEYREF
jgi:hypothetical protein